MRYLATELCPFHRLRSNVTFPRAHVRYFESGGYDRYGDTRGIGGRAGNRGQGATIKLTSISPGTARLFSVKEIRIRAVSSKTPALIPFDGFRTNPFSVGNSGGT